MLQLKLLTGLDIFVGFVVIMRLFGAIFIVFLGVFDVCGASEFLY